MRRGSISLECKFWKLFKTLMKKIKSECFLLFFFKGGGGVFIKINVTHSYKAVTFKPRVIEEYRVSSVHRAT